MFMGQYNHNLDAKGRLIVPAKLREPLGDHAFVTKGLDGCLFVYTEADWKVFEEKLGKLPITSPDARQFARFFLAGAADCEFDKQGRILLPQVLRDYAGLEKSVVLVGVASRIEIWSEQRWNEREAVYNQNMDEVAVNLGNLGFSI